MKAQVSVDYLIILAVALLLALLALGLFGFWPDLGTSTQITHQQNFWKNSARPLTVQDAFYDRASGRIYLELRSRSSDAVNLTGLYIGGQKLAFFHYNASQDQGVGFGYCDQSTCKIGVCACNLRITPYSDEAVVSEFYLPSAQFCSSQSAYALADARLDYRSPFGQALNQTPAYALPVACENGFNN